MTCLKSDSLNQMIDFVESLGICVNTNTKARGHQGFFMRNRIDISTTIPIERKKEVLVHEFAHYIHYKIESDVIKNHGTLQKLFLLEDAREIEKELLEVTRFVDKNLVMSRLNSKRDLQIEQIKILDKQIKSKYPDFKRSYPFKPFDSILKKTEAKYLLKYDRVKVKTPFLRRVKEYSIHSFTTDFPQFDELIKSYILIKSHQRMMKRISSRINRLNNYYKRPSELFARFVEGLYIDEGFVKAIAPNASQRFFELCEDGHYKDMKAFFRLFNSFTNHDF